MATCDNFPYPALGSISHWSPNSSTPMQNNNNPLRSIYLLNIIVIPVHIISFNLQENFKWDFTIPIFEVINWNWEKLRNQPRDKQVNKNIIPFYSWNFNSVESKPLNFCFSISTQLHGILLICHQNKICAKKSEAQNWFLLQLCIHYVYIWGLIVGKLISAKS